MARDAKINEEGIPKYLTSIIASRLSWVDDENVREHIWELASVRLSERSGRTGREPRSIFGYYPDAWTSLLLGGSPLTRAKSWS